MILLPPPLLLLLLLLLRHLRALQVQLLPQCLTMEVAALLTAGRRCRRRLWQAAGGMANR